jgi:hypothetical protein
MNTDFDILREITQEICKIDPMKETRDREVVYARMIMYKVLKSFHKHTVTAIGRMFGKHHATILHSIKQFDNMVIYDDWLSNRFHCVMSEYTKEISLQNEVIADVHLRNKILESKVNMQKRIIRQYKEISDIIDGVPEVKVEQIIQKLRMLSEVAKKEIKPRNQQTVLYNSNIVSHQ